MKKEGIEMSYYHSYFLGYMKNDKIYPYGPFDFRGRMKPIIEKSRSFASDLHNDFWIVQDNQITDELREQFEYEDWQGRFTNVRYLPVEDLPSDDYIKKGYFLIEDVQAWETEGDDSLFYHMISPTIYAEKMRNELIFGKNQPKKDIEGNEYTEPNASDYVYYAAPWYNSREYEAHLLQEAAGAMYDYDFFNDDVKMVILETEG